MTVEEATDRLLQTYSVYGVGREFLTGLMEDGIQNYNLSVEAVFHGTRMMLGQRKNWQVWMQNMVNILNLPEICTGKNWLLQSQIGEGATLTST